MIRTQEEILARFNEVYDFIQIQRHDLLAFMEYETAKPFLKDEYIEKVISGEESWSHLTDPKKEILDYLEFAYDKARSARGLSAARSLLHFKTWIWLDNDELYKELEESFENYTDYGIPVLDKIAKHYLQKS